MKSVAIVSGCNRGVVDQAPAVASNRSQLSDLVSTGLRERAMKHDSTELIDNVVSVARHLDQRE